MTITKQQHAAVFLGAAKREKARRDPVWFMREVLGCRPYDKQEEMALALRDYSRVATLGCNGSGKDWCAARLLLWWQWTQDEAITVVIGPTSRQVTDIVWKEARSAYRASLVPLGGRMFQTARWEFNDRRYAIGFATDSEFNIQGFHSPRLLCILTEAHNLEQAHVDAIKRLNPTRLLLTGNPFATAGEFFDAFHEKGDLYHTIEISAFDTPNVQQRNEVIPGMITWEQIEERERDWGEESPMYIASVLGRFPDNLEDAVVSRVLLLAAVERNLPPGRDEAILSCDVARFGADKTVIYRRHGNQCRMVWKVQGRDTQQVAGKLKALAEDDPAVATIVVDDSGIGGGVVDRLREEGVRDRKVRVMAFNGGAKARRDDRYVNAITEAWLELGAVFKSGRIDIDNNPALIAQLSSRRYTLQGDRRLKLEGKEEYKRRAAVSPDDADALAMAYAPMGGKEAETHNLLTRRRDPIANPLGLDMNKPIYHDRDRERT